MRWVVFAAASALLLALVGHGIAQTVFTTASGSGITAYQKAVIAAAGASLFGGLGT